jgi:hypothetical protein
MHLNFSGDVSFLPTGGRRKPTRGAGRRGGKGSGALPAATFAAALSDKGGGS